MTYVETLDLATAFIVLVCLWVRRATWHYKWEQAKTIGLALIAVGALLKAPPLGWLINKDILHGLHILVANILIVGGIAAFAYSAECKLRSDADMPNWRLKFVVVPGAIGITTMISLFSGGHPLGYWLAYDILTMYFLGLWAYALACLFADPPSRRAAGVFLLAVGLSLVSAVCRTLLITVEDHLPDPVLVDISATTKALAITLLAVSTAYMWRKRLARLRR